MLPRIRFWPCSSIPSCSSSCKHHAQVAERPAGSRVSPAPSSAPQAAASTSASADGPVAADALDADLGELAIPAALGLLVAEGRAGVVDAHRQRSIPQLVDVRPHHRGRQLGPQAQLPVPVGEAVHPGGDLFAGLAQEEIEVLQHRRVDAPVAEALEMVAQDRPSARAGEHHRRAVRRSSLGLAELRASPSSLLSPPGAIERARRPGRDRGGSARCCDRRTADDGPTTVGGARSAAPTWPLVCGILPRLQ